MGADWQPYSSQKVDEDMAVVVMRMHLRAIPLAMITMRKSTDGFPFVSHDANGAPLGGPLGRWSSAISACSSSSSFSKPSIMAAVTGTSL